MSVMFSLLGSGGWIPTSRRETTCALLSLPQALFIFDAGTGLSRLLEADWRSQLAAEREIHLFLSHYHLDHVAGLVYLPAMFKGRTLHLHPPAEEVTGVDPFATIASLIRPPFNPQDLSRFPVDLRFEPLAEGEHSLAGVKVAVRRQIHPDPSLAFRVGDHLVFATDTAADPGTAQFARGAALLVHEAWLDGIEEQDPALEHSAREAYVAHTSARQAAALAAQAGVGRLALSHLNPLRSDEYHAQMLASARNIFAASEILEDGERVEL